MVKIILHSNYSSSKRRITFQYKAYNGVCRCRSLHWNYFKINKLWQF